MTEINAAAVGKLREMTNAGLMDCKRALTEARGDLNAAVDILRKKGGKYLLLAQMPEDLSMN